MNKIIYHFKKKIYKFLRKHETLMQLNIEYYKSQGVEIGNNMRAFSILLTSEPQLLKFGSNITVSTNVTFLTHDNSVIKLFKDGTDVFGKISIGDDCFIGSGTIILPGVELGKGTIVGAGSVVTKSFKDGEIIIAGNPAKKICTTEEYRNKIQSSVLNIRGMDNSEKKLYLENNKDKLIEK